VYLLGVFLQGRCGGPHPRYQHHTHVPEEERFNFPLYQLPMLSVVLLNSVRLQIIYFTTPYETWGSFYIRIFLSQFLRDPLQRKSWLPIPFSPACAAVLISAQEWRSPVRWRSVSGFNGSDFFSRAIASLVIFVTRDTPFFFSLCSWLPFPDAIHVFPSPPPPLSVVPLFSRTCATAVSFTSGSRQFFFCLVPPSWFRF